MKVKNGFVLCNRLREYRMKKHATLVEVSHASGIDKNAIWRYENMQREPSLKTAFRLSAYYEAAINDLFYLKEADQ